MKAIKNFVSQFNATLNLDKKLVVKKRKRYYLLNESLKKQIHRRFFYAGVYLGEIRNATFFPSILLLSMMTDTRSNRVVVDEKTAWLFICGRDVFKQGIIEARGSRKGDYVLVLNEHNDCLGFGKALYNILKEHDAKKVVVKNVLDIGDFLRRERRKSSKRKKEKT